MSYARSPLEGFSITIGTSICERVAPDCDFGVFMCKVYLMRYDRSSFLAAYRPSWTLPLPEELELSPSPSLCVSTLPDTSVFVDTETMASIFVADSSAE